MICIRTDRTCVLGVAAVNLLLLAWSMPKCPAAQATEDRDPGPVTSGDHGFLLKVGDLDRRYTVHVPPGYDGRAALPVVIMLHGGGGTGRAAAVETGWSQKADRAGFLAVYPDAMPPDPTKPSSFARNPQLWNDGSERFYHGQNRVDDVGFLNAMLDDLSARFALDRRRVFVAGFSNGASMAFRVGAELSGRIAAIAPVAGAGWADSVKLERPVSMCYITGTADPLNLIEGGGAATRLRRQRQGSRQAEAARARVDPEVGPGSRVPRQAEQGNRSQRRA